MSTIKTLSAFWYGIRITNENKYIDFDEGSGELIAVLNLGDYSHTEFAVEIARAMKVAGTQNYSCSLNRVTRKLTIYAPLAFDLLTNSGSHTSNAAWDMIGMDTVADKTGLSSYLADSQTGIEYITQYPVDKYTSPEHSLVKEYSSVNVAASGVTQAVHFGDGSRPQMNIRVITDKIGLKIDPFFENANGIDAALDLMKYLITKGKVEFMPDKDQTTVFYKLILESTREARDGTDFTLKNMKVPDFYETGDLVFRKVLT